MVQLEIFSPEGKTKTVTLEKFPVTIGRSRTNDIVLTHRTVSRKHAIIAKRDGTYIIKDVGSQNGTFLRKRKIEEAVLQNEDVIYIGAYTLKFVIREEIIDLEKTVRGVAEDEKIKLKITFTTDIPDRFHGVTFPEDLSNKDQASELELSISKEDTSLLAFPDEFLVPREEFPTLYDLQRKTMEAENIEEALKNIANYLLLRTDGDRIAIFLDKGNGNLDLSLLLPRPGIDFVGKDLTAFPSLLKQSVSQGKAILANGLAEESEGSLDAKEKEKFSSYCAIFVPLKYDERTIGAIQIETYGGKDKIRRDQLLFVSRIIRELAQLIIWKVEQFENIEKITLRKELTRIYPDGMVDFLFQREQKYRQDFFEPKEQVASVLSCKIMNLQEIRERLSPLEITRLSQNFVTTVRKSIIHYKGCIVGICNEWALGVFGLPVKQLDGAVRAVLAALDAARSLERNPAIRKLDPKPLFGFGIQTGLTIGGDVTVNGYHSLFATGNPVDVSLELASLASKPNQILIAPEVFFDVRFYFDIEEIGLREISRPRETLMVYEVLELKESVSEESILYLASENADSEVTSEEFLKFPDV